MLFPAKEKNYKLTIFGPNECVLPPEHDINGWTDFTYQNWNKGKRFLENYTDMKADNIALNSAISYGTSQNSG